MVDIENKASGKPVDINAVQTMRRLVLGLTSAVCLVIFLFTGSVWENTAASHVDECIEYAGLLLIIVAILGRTWCSLYIAGRKKRLIVEVGPYSICRNPLYVFSFLGAAGVGAQFGTLSTAFVICGATILVFAVVVRKEERFLREKFGVAYEAYCARVPRFMPDFRLWRRVHTLEIQPALVMRTFFDACLFLVACPVAAAIESLQNRAYLPSLWLLL